MRGELAVFYDSKLKEDRGNNEVIEPWTVFSNNLSNNYIAGDITEDQARNSFEQCDLSGKENFKKRIIEVIDEVLKTNTSTDIEESSEEKSDEEKIVRPMKRAKKN